MLSISKHTHLCRRRRTTAKCAVPHGMWGCDGEAWNAAGPLSDWSFAGYAAGMAGIPSAAPAVDVKRDFRAVGDGRADDTAAVRAALAKTKSSGGVIYFPPGKYLLSGQLVLDSNQVLRGAGRDASKLYFTKSMNDLFGWGSSGYQAGKANSPYTWLGALISTQRTHKLTGDDMYLGKVTRPAFRGQRRLFVDFSGTRYAGKPANEVFIPGQWMALRMYENQNVRCSPLACTLIHCNAPHASWHQASCVAPDKAHQSCRCYKRAPTCRPILPSRS